MSDSKHPLESGPAERQPYHDPHRGEPHPLETNAYQTDTRPVDQTVIQFAIDQRVIVAFVLIAINVIVFLPYLYDMDTYRTLIIEGVNRARDVFRREEYYRLFTAMFLHGSLQHIIFNMVSLHYAAQIVEPFFGRVRFVLVYLLGGLGGSVLSVILQANNAPGSVGASGAVFALFGAQLVFLYLHRDKLGDYGRGHFRQLAILLGINLVIGFVPGSRIDNLGHLGGLLGGAVLAWFIGPRLLGHRAVYQTHMTYLNERQFPPLLLPVMGYSIGLLLLLLIRSQLG
jgi:rhomboid protease GluP